MSCKVWGILRRLLRDERSLRMGNVAAALLVLLGLVGPLIAAEPAPKRAEIEGPRTETIIVGREYSIELGPFHTSFRLPRSFSPSAPLDRLRGLLGIVVILAVAALFS